MSQLNIRLIDALLLKEVCSECVNSSVTGIFPMQLYSKTYDWAFQSVSRCVVIAALRTWRYTILMHKETKVAAYRGVFSQSFYPDKHVQIAAPKENKNIRCLWSKGVILNICMTLVYIIVYKCNVLLTEPYISVIYCVCGGIVAMGALRAERLRCRLWIILSSCFLHFVYKKN